MIFKNNIRLLFIICVSLILTQCTDKNRSVLEFPNNRWYQTDVLSLNYNNLSVKNVGNIILEMNYIHGFQFSEIPLEVYIISPSNQITKTSYSLKLIDENFNELGDCMGDYCDFSTTIVNNYNFSENGIYKIKVLNKFDNAYLPNIFSLAAEVK